MIGILLAALVFPLFYYFWTYHYDHWDKKNVVSLNTSFPYGSIKKIIQIKTNMIKFLNDAYSNHRSSKVVGFYAFRQPMLIIRDLDYIKDILVKDFNSFADNGFQTFASVDPLMALNPFCLRGPEWKVTRGIHSPSHSVAKLKLMVPGMVKTSMNFVKFLKEEQKSEICINEYARFYTTDAVASCAYSVENDSFFDKNSVFLKNTYGQLFTDTNLGALTAFFAPYTAFITRARTIQKKAEKFFLYLGSELIEQRKRDNFVGNDLIQHLISVQEKAEKTGGPLLKPLDVAVHLMTFYLDGSETASLALSSILFEIAAHEDIQEKLRDEINSNGKSPEDFDFSKLWSLNYLDMVMSEALRLHPPIPLLTRICTEDYNLGDVKIEKETKVFIPTYAIQNDPEIYPDPEKFDPERFSPEKRSQRHMATLLPFGEGPRICLGFRYAQTAMKMAILVLLMNFRLTIPPGRPKKITLDDTSSFVYVSKEDLYIKFEPL